jgi:hypothetical protein
MITEEQRKAAQLLIIPPSKRLNTPERRWWGHPDCIDFYLSSRREIRENSVFATPDQG